MIEISDSAFPSTKQWEIVVSGIRNPYSSWYKSDSRPCIGWDQKEEDCEKCTMGECDDPYVYGGLVIGEKDLALAKNLINSGVEHAKFLRQLPIIINITAPLYWWKQVDQYKVATTTDSCSTMHTLTKRAFKLIDFSIESSPTINAVIKELNLLRDSYLETKDMTYWHKIDKLLPQSYNQFRTWSGSYATLFNICSQRAGHKLPEWNTFIKWIIEEVPFFKKLCFDKLSQVSKPFRELFGDTE